MGEGEGGDGIGEREGEGCRCRVLLPGLSSARSRPTAVRGGMEGGDQRVFASHVAPEDDTGARHFFLSPYHQFEYEYAETWK